jgi:hypothetical protein
MTPCVARPPALIAQESRTHPSVPLRVCVSEHHAGPNPDTCKGRGTGVGWRVAARRSPLGSSDRARAEELRDTIRNGGVGASVHQGNVGDPDDCRRVVGEVIEQHGRLDILVNNAGVTVARFSQ